GRSCRARRSRRSAAGAGAAARRARRTRWRSARSDGGPRPPPGTPRAPWRRAPARGSSRAVLVPATVEAELDDEVVGVAAVLRAHELERRPVLEHGAALDVERGRALGDVELLGLLGGEPDRGQA